MKSYNTDNELFAQIKQSLDGYEEPYIPGSWENFVQTRKKKRRIIFLRIASGIAASLLIGILGINYLNSDKSITQSPANEQVSVPVNSIPQTVNPVSPKTIPAVITQNEHKQLVKSPNGGKSNSIIIASPNTANINKTANPPSFSAPVAENNGKVASASTGHETKPKSNVTDTVKNIPDTVKIKSTQDILNRPSGNETKNVASAARRKVRFGLNFSPTVNAAQSSGSFNYMGGLSADIPLSARLQLSTGLQVENQHVAQKNASIASAMSVPKVETTTQMINLDLPVNVTWKFVAEKSHAYYVSAGLSSLVHLKQDNKNTVYSDLLVPSSSLVGGVEVLSYNVVKQVSVNNNTVTPTQTFDFAGRINFMVGYEKKLSSRLFIHFEPYAKFPASGQSAGYLNQTTTGINFKVSF